MSLTAAQVTTRLIEAEIITKARRWRIAWKQAQRITQAHNV